MNNSENVFLPISACCLNHAGNDGRKFIDANGVAAAALALTPARGQDSNVAVQTQS
jgi:hypothetical protein